ncbi:uncharacterized protein LOC143594765 isoform X3 [Bidens hawaiensis]|uniref:uncharacterized protein LOC143594765 isoform X3 n=1 Tax=Bidens hawaiensis TaxID=980011 RepID=UPI00404A746A
MSDMKLKVMIPAKFKVINQIPENVDLQMDKSTCDAKRSSRSKMNEPHVTGTKSFARLSHEEAMNNNGVQPTRGELYIKTHTRKDGTIVDEEAAKVVASLKAIASDSTSKSKDPCDFSNDDYLKVKGPEKRGYVRLVGRMPTAKSKGDSSTNSHKVDRLMSVVNVMLNVIQEHIPNANLASVLRDMNIEVPSTISSVNQVSSSRNNNGTLHED